MMKTLLRLGDRQQQPWHSAVRVPVLDVARCANTQKAATSVQRHHPSCLVEFLSIPNHAPPQPLHTPSFFALIWRLTWQVPIICTGVVMAKSAHQTNRRWRLGKPAPTCFQQFPPQRTQAHLLRSRLCVCVFHTGCS